MVKKLHGPIPLYPLLLGIYPVLYLWNANHTQLPAYVVIPSFLVTLIYVILQYGFFALVLRSVSKGALISTVVGLFILAYGQFTGPWNNATITLRRIAFAIALVIFLALLVFLLTRKSTYRQLIVPLNVISLALVLFVALSGGYFYLVTANRTSVRKPNAVPAANLPGNGDKIVKVPSSTAPDVYFIIMDGYSRQDVLKNYMNFDNSEFVNQLKKRGFIFPDCATGNYPATAMVIGSILNMEYLDNLSISPEKLYSEDSYDVLGPYIHNNLAFKMFRSDGYKIVTFRGFNYVLDMQDVDYYANFEDSEKYSQDLATQQFQELYFNLTLFYPINNKLHVYPDFLKKHAPDFIRQMIPAEDYIDPVYAKVHRQDVYTIETMRKLPTLVSSPKFVYAHLYTTHRPYMIRPDGSLRLPTSGARTLGGYLDGVRYTNNQMLDVIDHIIADSKVPPVIILQSDHSFLQDVFPEWAGEYRDEIFSAYYLPNGGASMLYPTISPVNNLRLVFKYYLGENIDLLPDIHHYVRPDTLKPDLMQASCISTNLH